jgi:hypothetical protein
VIFLKYTINFFNVCVLLIALTSVFLKNNFKQSSIFFTVVFLNSFFEILFWVSPRNHYLNDTLNTLYQITFPSYLILKFIKREFNWELYVFIFLIITLLCVNIFSFPLPFKSNRIGLWGFSISCLVTLFFCIENVKKPNKKSILLFLVFCLLLNDLLYELAYKDYLIFTVDQRHFIYFMFFCILIFIRSIFIVNYGRQFIRK